MKEVVSWLPNVQAPKVYPPFLNDILDANEKRSSFVLQMWAVLAQFVLPASVGDLVFHLKYGEFFQI